MLVQGRGLAARFFLRRDSPKTLRAGRAIRGRHRSSRRLGRNHAIHFAQSGGRFLSQHDERRRHRRRVQRPGRNTDSNSKSGGAGRPVETFLPTLKAGGGSGFNQSWWLRFYGELMSEPVPLRKLSLSAHRTRSKPDQTVSILGVPLAYGASMAGVELGPAALRVARLNRADCSTWLQSARPRRHAG